MTHGAPQAASFPAVMDSLSDELSLVEGVMREQLATAGEVLALVGDHVLASGGKRMRPALVLLAAELCGYTGPRRIHMGAAIELMHTATLLHDDVVDVSEMRRGRPSANAIWGNRRAVLAGDFFYARSSTLIVEDGNLDILYVFANAIRSMAEGELLQLQHSFDLSITESHYFAVIERKSAALLSTACETGSILGGVTRAERRRLAEYGRELGLAFQLRDDSLDYEDREADLGKRPYDDLREGKVTFPLLLALKRCSSAERDAVGALLKAVARFADAGEPVSDDVDLDPAIDVVRRHRGMEDTVRRAEEHAARARAAIAPFADGPAKRALLAGADFAVSRDR
ncbi:MAG: polyprenyl synthetase family protein [Myxococcota bacterium]